MRFHHNQIDCTETGGVIHFISDSERLRGINLDYLGVTRVELENTYEFEAATQRLRNFPRASREYGSSPAETYLAQVKKVKEKPEVRKPRRMIQI